MRMRAMRRVRCARDEIVAVRARARCASVSPHAPRVYRDDNANEMSRRRVGTRTLRARARQRVNAHKIAAKDPVRPYKQICE